MIVPRKHLWIFGLPLTGEPEPPVVELAARHGIKDVGRLNFAIAAAKKAYRHHVPSTLRNLQVEAVEANRELIESDLNMEEGEFDDFVRKLRRITMFIEERKLAAAQRREEGRRNRADGVNRAIQILAEFYIKVFGSDRFIVGWRDQSGAWPFMREAISLVAEVSDNTLRAQMEIIVHEKRGRKAP